MNRYNGTLTKNQLAFVLESIAWSVRPTLQYAYYLPESKVLVSTDSFRLHELKVDLWDEPFLIDKNGKRHAPPPSYIFPFYKNFFPSDDVQKIPVLFDQKRIKEMYNVMKACKENVLRIEPDFTGHIRPDKNKNMMIQASIKLANNHVTFPHEFCIDSNLFYSATRYLAPTTEVQQKDPLAPFIVHSSIEGYPARALIMPLKY